MNHGGPYYANESTRKPERFTPRVFKASDFEVTPTPDRKSIAIRAPCGETVILPAREVGGMIRNLIDALRKMT